MSAEDAVEYGLIDQVLRKGVARNGGPDREA